MHLGTRPCSNQKSNLGRETFLTPIRYVDGWFHVDTKKAALENEISGCKKQISNNEFFTDFSGKNFEKEWLFLNYRNVSRNNILILNSQGTALTLAAIRQPDFECNAEAEFEFQPESIGDESGLIIYLQSDFNYRLCKTKREDGSYITVQKYAEDFVQTAYEEKIDEGKITVSIRADKKFYYFYYSLNNAPLRELCRASTHFMCAEVPERCFTGTLIGLYAIGSSPAGFYSFKMK